MNRLEEWEWERARIDKKLVNGILSRAMVILSHTQYKYFRAYHAGTFTITHIARRYGVSPSTVSQTIDRAEKLMIEKWGI